MSCRHVSVFDDPDVAAELAELHQKVCCCSGWQSIQQHCVCLQNTLYQLPNGGAWYEYYDRNPIYNLTVMSNEDIQISPRKKFFYLVSPRNTPCAKKYFSRRKIKITFFAESFVREMSRRNSAKVRGETPQNFAEALCEISRRNSAKSRWVNKEQRFLMWIAKTLTRPWNWANAHADICLHWAHVILLVLA